MLALIYRQTGVRQTFYYNGTVSRADLKLQLDREAWSLVLPLRAADCGERGGSPRSCHPFEAGWSECMVEHAPDPCRVQPVQA